MSDDADKAGAAGEAAEPIDYSGKKYGMWFFLFTEILFFGGLFLLYSVYRYRFPAAFHKGASDEIVPLGAANTAILITGSLLISFSLTAVRRGKRRLATALQAATVLLGGVFLAIKIHEWLLKIGKGIYPNGPALKSMPDGEILYFGLYYTMTGLHGVHVLVGMVVISFMAYFTWKGVVNRENFSRLENTTLYWHFVDIIWIYLFPLFYLIT
jgi:cytochrome c oxidase subunit 3